MDRCKFLLHCLSFATLSLQGNHVFSELRMLCLIKVADSRTRNAFINEISSSKSSIVKGLVNMPVKVELQLIVVSEIFT